MTACDVNAIDKKQVLEQIDALTNDGVFSQQDINYLINYLIAHGNFEGTPRDLVQVRRGLLEHLPNLAQGEMAITLDTEEVFFGGLNGNFSLSSKSSVIDIKNLGGNGNGVALNDAVIAKAISETAKQGLNTIRIPEGVYKISKDVVFPKNIVVEFAFGGSLTADTKVSVTFNEMIRAGLSYIFKGSVSPILKKNSVIYPQWFGAVGDGVTDDIVAFEKALAYDGFIDVVVEKATYLLSRSLVFKAKTLIGVGIPTLKFAITSPAMDGVIMEHSSRDTRETTLSGFLIDMNKTGRHGIWLNGGDYPVIRDCRVINSVKDGVHLEPKNSYSWIENYNLDRVQVYDAGGDGFGFVISDRTMTNVFINYGVLNNCEVRGVGSNRYAIYVESTSDNYAAISSMIVNAGGFDSRAGAGQNGVYSVKAGNGVVERLIFNGATIENTLEAKTGCCLSGVPAYVAIGVVPYNYANGIMEIKDGNICLASPGYEFMSLRGIVGRYTDYQYVSSAAAQIGTNVTNRKCEQGSAITLSSKPSFADGKTISQEFTLIGEGYPITLQDDASLSGSKLKLLSPTVTIGAKQSVTFRWDGIYWRQVTPVSA